MGKRREAEAFLKEIRAAAKLEQKDFFRRKKNTEGLLRLNLTEVLAWEIIERLTPDNYHAGPEPEHDNPDEDVWKFGHDHKGTEIYIKLTFSSDPKRKNIRRAKVWSFHRAERPMTYPLKGKRK